MMNLHWDELLLLGGVLTCPQCVFPHSYALASQKLGGTLIFSTFLQEEVSRLEHFHIWGAMSHGLGTSLSSTRLKFDSNLNLAMRFG
jgi:hypothetical protein